MRDSGFKSKTRANSGLKVYTGCWILGITIGITGLRENNCVWDDGIEEPYWEPSSLRIQPPGTFASEKRNVLSDGERCSQARHPLNRTVNHST